LNNYINNAALMEGQSEMYGDEMDGSPDYGHEEMDGEE
jgi:hypothetical protein